MSESRVPDSPPTLLPGPTAADLNRRDFTTLVGSLAGAGIMVVGSLLEASLRQPVVASGLIIAVVFILLGFRSNSRRAAAERREAAAGYTTLNFRSRHLWQVDPKTGAVIRQPDKIR